MTSAIVSIISDTQSLLIQVLHQLIEVPIVLPLKSLKIIPTKTRPTNDFVGVSQLQDERLKFERD